MTSSSSLDMNCQEAEMVKKTIESSPVVVFSKTQCPYCVQAKGILQGMGVEMKVMELDHMEQGSLIQDILEKMTSARTVPRVFINGQCIGGCSELQQLHQSGKLSEMFQSMY